MLYKPEIENRVSSYYHENNIHIYSKIRSDIKYGPSPMIMG